MRECVNPERSTHAIESPMSERKSLLKFFNKLSGQPELYAKKQQYTFGRTLGAGLFGIVRYARDNETNEEVAVKIILKKALKGNESMVLDEMKLLEQLHHPNIVGFRNWFELKDKYYLVTQLATGGELFDRIVARGRFTEKDALLVIVQVLEALKYLHHRDIVHRDIKPENILYLTPDEDANVVLADFGIAKQLKDPKDMLFTSAGLFGYAAPEVIMGTGHGKPCDVWLLGVICYSLLCGYSPFRSENVNDFINEVKHNNAVIFHADYWRDVLKDARRFIIKTLQFDPSKRPTVDELLQDPWLVLVACKHTETDLLPNLKEGFDAKAKFRHAIEIVKLNNRIKKLKELQGDDGDDDPSEIDHFDAHGSIVQHNDDASFQHSLQNQHAPLWDSFSDAVSLLSLKDIDLQASLSSLKLPYAKKKKGAAGDAFAQLVQAASSNRDRVLSYQKETQAEEAKKTADATDSAKTT